MSALHIARGKKKDFDRINKDSNTLYVIIDSGELYMGDILIADVTEKNLPSGVNDIDYKYKDVYGRF